MRGLGIRREIPIWFFVGVLLTVYGALIGGHGVYGWVTHRRDAVVLAGLHAPMWWGGILLILGLIYCVKFFPGKPTLRQGATGKH